MRLVQVDGETVSGVMMTYRTCPDEAVGFLGVVEGYVDPEVCDREGKSAVGTRVETWGRGWEGEMAVDGGEDRLEVFWGGCDHVDSISFRSIVLEIGGNAVWGFVYSFSFSVFYWQICPITFILFYFLKTYSCHKVLCTASRALRSLHKTTNTDFPFFSRTVLTTSTNELSIPFTSSFSFGSF